MTLLLRFKTVVIVLSHSNQDSDGDILILKHFQVEHVVAHVCFSNSYVLKSEELLCKSAAVKIALPTENNELGKV